MDTKATTAVAAMMIRPVSEREVALGISMDMVVAMFTSVDTVDIKPENMPWSKQVTENCVNAVRSDSGIDQMKEKTAIDKYNVLV